MADKIEKPYQEDPNYFEKGFPLYFPGRPAETIQQPATVPGPIPALQHEPQQPLPPPPPEPPPPAPPPQENRE